MIKLKSRCLGLDLLRLVAVILVLFRHLHFPEAEEHVVLSLLSNGGWVGVDISCIERLFSFGVVGMRLIEFPMMKLLDRIYS
jgi:peptidoglycan/LPS O-acetylase OafA/YrhL